MSQPATVVFALGGQTLTLGRLKLRFLLPVISDLELMRSFGGGRLPTDAEVRAMLRVIHASVRSAQAKTDEPMMLDDLEGFFLDADDDGFSVLAKIPEAFNEVQTLSVPPKDGSEPPPGEAASP